jgi:hypothetical protein
MNHFPGEEWFCSLLKISGRLRLNRADSILNDWLVINLAVNG